MAHTGSSCRRGPRAGGVSAKSCADEREQHEAPRPGKGRRRGHEEHALCAQPPRGSSTPMSSTRCGTSASSERRSRRASPAPRRPVVRRVHRRNQRRLLRTEAHENATPAANGRSPARDSRARRRPSRARRPWPARRRALQVRGQRFLAVARFPRRSHARRGFSPRRSPANRSNSRIAHDLVEIPQHARGAGDVIAMGGLLPFTTGKLRPMAMSPASTVASRMRTSSPSR